MKLFQPNNLSKRTPEFTPLNDSLITAQIASLLAEPVRVSVFAGANVSSQNFKVETPPRTWFLKTRELDFAAKMLEEAKLTVALSELGQRVPRIVRSRAGELVTVSDERCWVLYEFQEGDYFTGRGGEMQAAAETFAELSLAARQLFSPSGVVEDPLPDRLEELLDRAPHGAMIGEQLRLVKAQLLTQPVAPMHLDYHPLNLLMNDGQVACVVDLEHLKPYPVVSGLGFAAFKLIRQAMVDNEFRGADMVPVWLQAWQKSFPEHRFTVTDLGLGARARILKLIYLILDASLNRNDHRSDYDLEKQIVSLYEANVIFGEL